jgi:hypothetical protein
VITDDHMIDETIVIGDGINGRIARYSRSKPNC